MALFSHAYNSNFSTSLRAVLLGLELKAYVLECTAGVVQLGPGLRAYSLRALPGLEQVVQQIPKSALCANHLWRTRVEASQA